MNLSSQVFVHHNRFCHQDDVTISTVLYLYRLVVGLNRLYSVYNNFVIKMMLRYQQCCYLYRLVVGLNRLYSVYNNLPIMFFIVISYEKLDAHTIFVYFVSSVEIQSWFTML